MLKWAIVCFILSAITGLLGFTQASADLAGIGKVLFFIFLFFFIFFLIAGLFVGRKVASKLGGLLILLSSGLWAGYSSAADPTPIPDSPYISPGRYTANVMPGINGDMAKRLKESLNKMNGLEDVDVKTLDGSLHFTVKDGSQIRVTELQKAVAKVDSKAVMTTPALEKSLSANPGL